MDGNTDLIQDIKNAAPNGRRLIAIAGPPASGKTTLAAELASQIKGAVVVPMDGFHLDNAILDQRKLLSRKGAPETFDAAGFLHLVQRIADGQSVYYPLFDRTTDRAIAGAGQVASDSQTVIFEGNYLLFDAPQWRDLLPYWNYSMRLDVAPDVLRNRLVKRWLDHGFSQSAAQQKADVNDMPNALRVMENQLPCDRVIQNF